MRNQLTWCVALLLAGLAACGTVPPGAFTPIPWDTTTPSIAVTATPTAAALGTASVSTAVPVASTGLPANTTLPPAPTAALPTPIPPLPAGASPTELKYQVLDHFPNFFFCDPDIYPVARADEADLARERFPELQANPEEFQAILKRNGLAGRTSFTDDQKLLIYREHKRLAAVYFELSGDRYRFRLQIVDPDGQGWIVQGLIDGRGTLTAQERERTIATCPRCLAADTWIATPQGPVAVEDLRVGDAVWTLDAAGVRRPATIVRTARLPVPAGHWLVHLVLSDGRELWASPGHPTATGRMLGVLQPGDLLDGARVVRLERVPYGRPATYDLLPAGDTGQYWANGIRMGSTLAGP